MREILFRGKCIDETCLKGQWLEGQILHDGVTGKYYINKENCLNESDNVGEEGLLRFIAYEVDPETVCQYTGLTDKNSKKIFEGDIIKHYNNPGNPGEYVIDYIKWNQNRCQFVKQGADQIEYPINTKCTYEVIGNIFDNPELLKGGKSK